MTGGMTLLAYAKKDIELLNERIAELKRQLAETRQYLAVAEGQADGGPPGWIRRDTNRNCWKKEANGEFLMVLERWKSCGSWDWMVRGCGDLFLRGSEATAREAIAAAEAAYQKAIKGA